MQELIAKWNEENDRRNRRQRIKDQVHACILCSLIFAIMVAAAYVEACT